MRQKEQMKESSFVHRRIQSAFADDVDGAVVGATIVVLYNTTMYS